MCRTASELRASLEAAAKARAALEAAVRALGRGGRAEDEATVESAINEAIHAGGHLLEEDVERARDSLQRWRDAAACEAKLTRALKSGTNTAHLARTIQVWVKRKAVPAVTWLPGGTLLGLGRDGRRACWISWVSVPNRPGTWKGVRDCWKLALMFLYHPPGIRWSTCCGDGHAGFSCSNGGRKRPHDFRAAAPVCMH